MGVMQVSIIVTGCVGLVPGACLAEVGHEVACVDVDGGKVDHINRGETPIYEEGLQDLLRRNVGTRLRATIDIRRAVHDSEITFIAVGTPFDGERIDLSYIRQVARDIGAAPRDKDAYHVVVVKSTAVPGTTDGVGLPLVEEAWAQRAGTGFGACIHTEF